MHAGIIKNISDTSLRRSLRICMSVLWSVSARALGLPAAAGNHLASCMQPEGIKMGTEPNPRVERTAQGCIWTFRFTPSSRGDTYLRLDLLGDLPYLHVGVVFLRVCKDLHHGSLREVTWLVCGRW